VDPEHKTGTLTPLQQSLIRTLNVGCGYWNIAIQASALGEGDRWEYDTDQLHNELTLFEIDLRAITTPNTAPFIELICQILQDPRNVLADGRLSIESRDMRLQVERDYQTLAEQGKFRPNQPEVRAMRSVFPDSSFQFRVDLQALDTVLAPGDQRIIAGRLARIEARSRMFERLGVRRIAPRLGDLLAWLDPVSRELLWLGLELGRCRWRCWLPALPTFGRLGVPREWWALRERAASLGFSIPKPRELRQIYDQDLNARHGPSWLDHLLAEIDEYYNMIVIRLTEGPVPLSAAVNKAYFRVDEICAFRGSSGAIASKSAFAAGCKRAGIKPLVGRVNKKLRYLTGLQVLTIVGTMGNRQAQRQASAHELMSNLEYQHSPDEVFGLPLPK